MALYQNVSVTITSLGGGQFNLQVGPEGYTIDSQTMIDMIQGRNKSVLFLLHQIILKLDASGFTFAGKTPAQIKAAIEALTLSW